MIAAEIRVSFIFAPGNAHRSDERARINLVLVREENRSAQPIHRSLVSRVAAQVCFRRGHRAFPLADILIAMFLEGRRQRLQQFGG